MKYYCECCDITFDEPKKFVENHGFDTPPYEEFYGCPCCGGGYDEVAETQNEEYEEEENER